MGTVGWRCERTGPAAGVALGRPANRVAWRSLKDTMLYKNSKKKKPFWHFTSCRLVDWCGIGVVTAEQKTCHGSILPLLTHHTAAGVAGVLQVTVEQLCGSILEGFG